METETTSAGMSTKVIVGVLVAAAVVVGVYFIMNSNEATDAIKAAESVDAIKSTNANGKKMAFSEFIKNGGTYKCTVNQSVAGTDTTGTIYINDDMMRGEYGVVVQGMNIQTSMIVRDGYTYSWSSMTPNSGFKMKVAKSSGDTTAAASGNYSFNAEQIGDYNCESWNVDGSKFSLPTEVTFKEI